MMQKVRRPTVTRRQHSSSTGCRHSVSGSFHSPLGDLFTFPSRYLFTIGHLVVFSLRRWSSQVPTGFHVSRCTQVRTHCSFQFRLQDYHLLWSSFPAGFSYQSESALLYALQPQSNRSSPGLGCSRFAHRYWGNLY